MAEKEDQVDDFETDCCEGDCCLCAPYKENIIFSNRPMMVLRTSNIVRVCLAGLLGLILGICIQETKPEMLPHRTCMTQVSPFSVMENGFNCENFGRSTTFSALGAGALPTETLSICVKDPRLTVNNINFHPLTQASREASCGAGEHEIKVPISTTDAKWVCYHTAEADADGEQVTLFRFDDDAECSKLKEELGEDSTSKILVTISGTALGAHEACYTWTTNGKAQVDFIETGTNAPCVQGANTEIIMMYQENPLGKKADQEIYADELWRYKRIAEFVFRFPGALWVSALKLIVVPLVIANIITSVATLRQLPGAGQLGCYTFLYYVITTLLAALSGLFWVLMVLVPSMEPIEVTEMDIDVAKEISSMPTETFENTLDQIRSVIDTIVPKNFVGALANNNFVGMIFFSICLAIVIPNPKTSRVYEWLNEANRMLLDLVYWLIMLTPLGVFLMLTNVFMLYKIQDIIGNVGLFLACIMSGLAFHNFFVYPALYFFATKKNPFVYWLNVLPAAVTALGTSSSIATLPVTMDCAIKRNKIRAHVAKFVLSLGATVNMDGTSIGFPCAVVFVALGEGISMNLGDMITAVLLSTVSSMGAAPIPQSGLVLLVVILGNLSIPTSGVFFLIIAVDWLYDRPETMTNIVGDSFAAGILDHYLGEDYGQFIQSDDDAPRESTKKKKTKTSEEKQPDSNPVEEELEANFSESPTVLQLIVDYAGEPDEADDESEDDDSAN